MRFSPKMSTLYTYNQCVIWLIFSHTEVKSLVTLFLTVFQLKARLNTSRFFNLYIYYSTKMIEHFRNCIKLTVIKLRCDERLLHVVAFSKKLRWSAQTNVITLKTLLHAVNARWKRLSQPSFRNKFWFYSFKMILRSSYKLKTN